MAKDTLNRVDKLTIIGLVSAGIGLLLIPLLFSAIGIICGLLLLKEGSKTKGTIVILVSVIFGVVGLLFGIPIGSIAASMNPQSMMLN